jgi:acyl carrier protein
MNLFPKLRDAVALTLNVPVSAIKATTRDQDLAAWDSIGHVNLMMAIEQTFGLQLDVEDFAQLNSIPSILDYLNSRNVG